jgi:DNA-directed RNA polymerase specialized sigma24 family protein
VSGTGSKAKEGIAVVLELVVDGEVDPRRLALIYEDETRAPSERTAAFTELVAAYANEPGGAAGDVLAELIGPLIRRLARETAHGGTPGDHDEFVDEALAFVIAPREHSPPRICLYRAEEGLLEAWLRTLLKNRWLDKCRARARERLVFSDALEAEAPERAAPDWPDEPELFIRIFSPADLDRIDRWKAAERVELLCLAGLWRKVTMKIWELWLTEYEAKRDVVLARPFPPPWFVSYDDPPSRTRVLAPALSYANRNTLTQRWWRGQHRLGELHFIQSLHPNLKFAQTQLPGQSPDQPGDMI